MTTLSTKLRFTTWALLLKKIIVIQNGMSYRSGTRRVRMNLENWNSLKADDQQAWDCVSDELKGKSSILDYYASKRNNNHNKNDSNLNVNNHTIIFDTDDTPTEIPEPRVEISTYHQRRRKLD